MSLKLIYRGNIFVVNRTRPALQMGRDDSNDIVIVSLFASRLHARVQARDGPLRAHRPVEQRHLPAGRTSIPAEVHLRREEAVLSGRGWIGLGKSAAKHGDHSVRFALQAEGFDA